MYLQLKETNAVQTESRVGKIKVIGYSFPAIFSALMNQVPPFAVERFSHVDQRIEG